MKISVLILMGFFSLSSFGGMRDGMNEIDRYKRSQSIFSFKVKNISPEVSQKDQYQRKTPIYRGVGIITEVIKGKSKTGERINFIWQPSYENNCDTGGCPLVHKWIPKINDDIIAVDTHFHKENSLVLYSEFSPPLSLKLVEQIKSSLKNNGK